MKLFKKFASLCLALTFCVSLGAIASCGKTSAPDDNSAPTTSDSIVNSETSVVPEVSEDAETSVAPETSEEDEPAIPTVYTVIVLDASGAPVSGANVQFCSVDASGNLGVCYMPVATDANGICVYNPINFPGEGIYEIHVLNGTVNGAVRTEATFGTYTITLS